MQANCSASYLLRVAFSLHLVFSPRGDMFHKIPIVLQQTTWHFIPENRNLHHNTLLQLFMQLAYCSNIIVAVDDCSSIQLFMNQD
jgi:hypothetical protein